MIHMKGPGLFITKINKDMRKFVICCKVIGALSLTVHLSLTDESLFVVLKGVYFCILSYSVLIFV